MYKENETVSYRGQDYVVKSTFNDALGKSIQRLGLKKPNGKRVYTSCVYRDGSISEPISLRTDWA